MGDARSRLLVAIAASGALHLALIYGVTVRTPLPAAPVVARLEPAAAPPTPATALAPERTSRPSPAPSVSPATASGPALPSPRPAVVQPQPPALPRLDARVVPPPDSPRPSVEMPLLADPTWYGAQDLDVYPRALGPVEPGYPAQAEHEGIGGEVTLVLKVDEHGAVQDVAVVKATPEGYFEAASIEAFQAARFVPAERDGRSVRSQVVVRVSFNPRQAQ